MLINRPSEENGKKAVDVQKGRTPKASCEEEANLKCSTEDSKDMSRKRSKKGAADRSAIAKAFEDS